jgi:DNA-binding NarL/FixJ family response regulator
VANGDNSEADRRRHDSIYDEENEVPDKLLHDLANTPVVRESELAARSTHPGALSADEKQVVEWISHGLTDKMIAEVLGKSVWTVRDQAKAARNAVAAKTRAHLVAIALRRGLIE